MRVLVYGSTDTAKGLRSLISQDAVLILGERFGQFTIKLTDDAAISHPIVDGVDSELERLIVTHLAQSVGAVTVLIERGKAIQTDAIGIRVPAKDERVSYDVERSVYRALLDQARPPQPEEPTEPGTSKADWALRQWWWWLGWVIALLLLGASAARAQTAPVTVRDSATGAVVPNVGSTANNALRVFCVGGSCSGGGGGGGTSMADRATFTFGTDNLTPIGGVFDDTPPSVLTTGMVGVPRLTANRALHVNLRDASGTAVTVTGNSLNVNCTGGCGGAVAFEDNDAFTFNTTSVNVTGFVVDDTSPNTVTENSAGAPRMSTNRVPYGIIRDGAGNERGANVTAANELLVELGAGAASIGVLGANSGVDIGDVTINNASGASAVNIQDGGNSITVDGTVAVSNASQTVTAMQTAATANGNGTAATTSSNTLLSIHVDCASCAGGTTVSFEASFDNGTNYVPIRARRVGTTQFATSTTTAGVTAWEIPLLSVTRIRTPISNYSAGTITTSAKYNGVGSGPNAIESVIRDAAGNDRGANVTAGGALVVDGSAVTQPVSDAGGSLTVDGTVTVTDGAGALNVIVDSSALPSGAATSAIQTDGTQKTQIVDSGGTVVNATGTSLDVNCTGGCGGAAAFEDDDAFTPGTTTIGIIGAEVDDTGTTAATENSAAAVRMSTRRELYQQIRDAAGNERGANVTAANALKVDGSAVTQPVSGTITVTDGAGALNVIVDSGTLTAITNAVTVAGAAADGAAVSGNPVRIAGKDGSGNTQDIITDASGELQVDVLTLPNVTVGTFPDNEPFNVAQINGVTPLMGNGASGTGAQRVTIANDSTGVLATVSTVTAVTSITNNVNVVGTLAADGAASGTNRVATLPAITETTTLPTLTDGRNAALYGDTNGILYTRTIDPCSAGTKQQVVININTATTTELTPSLAGSGNHYYICSINLGPTAAAQNAALVDDDSDGCGSVTSGIAGGTTAGTGWNFPANGGLFGGNGAAWIARTNGTNRVLCLVTSAAVQISGVMTVVAAP